MYIYIQYYTVVELSLTRGQSVKQSVGITRRYLLINVRSKLTLLKLEL